MEKSSKFSCVIIGSGTLPIRCAEILSDNGHEIRTFVSSDPEVKRWTKEKNVSHLFPTTNLSEQLRQQSFDYLFSIVNEHILGEDVLHLPRNLAINYHDAPLPRYAGNHATSWALMNNETSHGISWHVITDIVDAGDILKQQRVGINRDDTALILNTKCYEAAINSFAQLVEELSTGNVVAKKQNLDERTFFARYKRPANGCVISWNSRASELSAFVRALNFGPHPNPIGSPKIAIGGEFFIVQKIEDLNSAFKFPPGTIIKIGTDFLRVSTADRDIDLKDVLTLDGQVMPILDLVARFGLQEGYRFTDLDSDIAEHLNSIYAPISKHEAFWLKRLTSLEPVVLPYANSTVSSGASNYASVAMPVPNEIASFWVNQQSEKGELLLTAYAILLARLGGVDNFDIGYSDPDIQKEIAGLEQFFANNTPLRLEIDFSQNFPEVFQSVKEHIESNKKYKTYARDLFIRYPQLYSTPETDHRFALPIIVKKVEWLADHKISPGSEITLVISENEPECRWVYNQEKFGDEQIAKLASHFTILLQGIAANSEQPIAYLPLLTDDERHQLLVEWNDNRADYPKHQCIHQLFEEQVARTPNAVALISGKNSLTYRELNRRANQLAHYLHTSGVGPDVPVGVCVERSAEMIVGFLAILKAGGTYTPLDPAYPSERLKFILDDAQMKLVLTKQSFLHQVQNQCERVMCIDTDWSLIAEESEENPVGYVTSDNTAYVIYTSGSTGKPKGVLVPHTSLVNHSLAIAKLYELKSNDRILQFASFNFDVAAEELFPSLLRGAAVVLLPEQVRAYLKEFSEFLRDEKITVVNLPASYWHQWVLSLADSEAFLPDTIRLVITGSERVLLEDYNTWQKIAGSHIRWLNGYGLTETTITSLVFDPTRSEPNTHFNTVPIGRPISNTEIYLLDEHLQPVPVGVPGQLYIGGDCLARGYLNQPELTAEKFIPNPFSTTPEARLYKSGDIVRYLHNGEIEYLDRVDNQVKIRGYRIELGEIESALSAHPKLLEAAVIVKEDVLGDMRLVAYFVPREEDRSGGIPQVELWASVGEYPVYDELMYYAMSTDKPRTSRYETAIKELVKDKTVVEIGTGKDAILARFCIAAGAKKVYAIEALDDAYIGAEALVKSLGLSDKITLIKGFSFDVQLPEKVDVCVSEIIGTIGGSEGAVPILNDARRFLKENGRMIPERCATKIAAVQLPDDFVESPHFTTLSGEYAEKIFQQVGYKFDVRVCLQNLPQENILSDNSIFEDLDFTRHIKPEYSNEIVLNITKGGRVDGFLLWLNLHTLKDVVIDTLKEDTSWLPLYFPVFEPGIDVNPGDTIKAVCRSSICENGFNPDYRIKGVLLRKNGEVVEFAHSSAHHQPVFQQTPFYQKLFFQDKIQTQISDGGGISAKSMRFYLSELLPNYMVPSAFVELNELPLTPNGKVNRKALPAPEPVIFGSERTFVPPRNETEMQIAKIWEKILETKQPIGVTDDFFDLGGGSLHAVRMFVQIEKILDRSLPLATLFQAATIEQLANLIRQDEPITAESSLVPIQPNGTKPIFFCVHAKGGNVLFYRDLARYLGTDQPFYGIQARRLDGRQVGHATVEEMAEFYINEIQTLQPEGPYYLGGSSFGGLVVFEMAQQFHKKGHKVALLALLDTGTPDYPRMLPNTTRLRSKIYSFVRRVQHHKDSLRLLNSKEKFEYALEKTKKFWKKYRRKIKNNYKKARRKVYTMSNRPIPKNLIQLEDKIERAGQIYVPQVYPGKMTLFRATTQPLGIYPDPTLGWEGLAADGLEIHEVLGHHGSIVVKPYVRNLAEEVRRYIEKAHLEREQTVEKAHLIESDEREFIKLPGF